MKIRNLIKMLFLSVVVFSSCTQEPMIGPELAFSTSLTDNVAYAGEAFAVRVERDKAQFYTVYFGETPETTFGEPGASGRFMNQATDSIENTYQNLGEYMLTVVASSTGNQAADSKLVSKSIKITVLDRRAAFSKFQFSAAAGDEVNGRTNGNEIIADVADYPGRNYVYAPIFYTTSDEAVVTVNGAVQTSGVTKINFANATKANPVKYVIQSLDGESATYFAYLEKTPPADKAELSFIQTLKRGLVADEAAPIVIAGANPGDPDRNVIDLICYNSPAGVYSLNISSSYGSSVKIKEDGAWLNFNSADTYDIYKVDSIRVIAQNMVATADFEFYTYAPLLTSFTFTKAATTTLAPQLPATVDLETKTITRYLSKSDFGANLNELVAEWAGSMTKVQIVGDKNKLTTIESGVSKLDFSKIAGDERVMKLRLTVGNTTADYSLILILTD